MVTFLPRSSVTVIGKVGSSSCGAACGGGFSCVGDGGGGGGAVGGEVGVGVQARVSVRQVMAVSVRML
ncbi:MAG: hypothetical protein FJ008_00940 [Chloroflexi bacterium]|nr:hypothetical protein [Chloroflexota bacterium]MBM3173342.1 hypothetical protein [Chloroflexota bacterium]MBM3174841.1 hypothetical protein [Chloroflexota bacterium]MBM4449314.1 hypothetical protein [Chloroflexota bacterium]